MDKSYLGNLAYNAGQDFNIIISNASFEQLKKFKDWASESDNGGATNNGLGTNIKNSFIICSPQQDDDEVIISTDVQKINYRESGNAIGYQEGDDELIDSTTISTSKMVINKSDTGDTDLIVTDHLGNFIRLTPPFTDIDTTYFSVKKGIITNESIIPNNTMYGCRALTFNDTFSKIFNNISNTILELSYTYIPLLNYRNNKNTDGSIDDNSSYSTVAYWYKNNVGNKVWTAVSYNQNKEGRDKDFIDFIETYSTSNVTEESTYHAYGVSFIDLLNSYYTLLDEHNKVAYNLNLMANKIQYIENLFNTVVFKVDTNMPSYIWTGSTTEYTNFIKDKESDETDSYIFIHQI